MQNKQTKTKTCSTDGGELCATGTANLPEKKNHHHLGRDTIFYASGIFIDRLLGLALIPMLTKLLSNQEYGAWTQTSITAGLLVSMILYSFPTVIVRHQSANTDPYTRKKFFDHIGILCIIFCAAWCTAMLSMSTAVGRLVYGNSIYTTLVPALLLWAIAEAAIEFAIAWLRAIGWIGIVACTVIARTILKTCLVIALTSLSQLPLNQWLLLHSTGLMIFAALLLLVTRRAICSGARSSMPPTTPPLKSQIAEATPLVALSILGILSGYLDRYLLTAWFGLNIVATYSAAASLAALPSMIHSILGFTVFPVMSRQWALGQKAEATHLMNQALLLYLFFALPVAFSVAGFGSLALPIITTGEYKVSSIVFIALSISILSLGLQQIFIYGLLLDGRGSRLLLLAVLAVAFNFTLALLLVPKLGIYGAAFAAALANFATTGMTAREVAKLPNWRFPWRQALHITTRAIIFTLPAQILAVTEIFPAPHALAALLALGLIYLMTDWMAKISLLRSLIQNRPI